jgi:hypothetical protein
MKKKNIIIAVVVLISILLLWFLSDKIFDNQATDVAMSESEIAPFEKAKALKDEYVFYDDVMEQLRLAHPNTDNLLTEHQTSQLFPELWIGQNISCRAIESASFFRKDFESTEIEGNLETGTDRLSVKVNYDDTITFLTSASVETGSTEGSVMDILVNNEFTLIASDLESDKFLDTLTISKETGMGVWQSVNASGLPMTYEVPDSQMIYLRCITPDTI